MSTTLVFGVLLIVAGIAFAILAYALILNRRSEDQPAIGALDAEPGMAEAQGPEPAAAQAESGVVAAVAPVPPQAESGVAAGIAPVAQQAESGVAAGIALVAPQPTLQTPTPPAAALPPQTLDVARLLREEVTGSLMVAVGSRIYRTAAELRSSPDWTRLQVASVDLQTWFTAPVKAKPAEERRAEEPAPRAASMLDQINTILERKLALVPELPQGVRLAPSPEGGVRVLIGLQAYPLDQVPDAKVNQLIRESVSEWENQG